jgi:RNA polymerase sigma-70 factor (ECF subfamily)
MALPPNHFLNAALPIEHSSLELAGDSLAIESLVHAHFPDVYRLALSILDDNHEAEDVAQETFIAAAAGLERFRGESKVRTWLFGIAINLYRSRLRKLRSRKALQSALEAIHLLRPRQQTPEDHAVHSEIRAGLWTAIHALDEKHRLPVILHYLHELSVPEISDALDVEQGTIYSRLHYARKKLHQLLKQADPSFS